MILMNQNKPVAEIEMITNKPVYYKEIYNKDKLPLGTLGNNKEQERILLNHWYKSRSIPNLRPNINKIEEKLGISKTEAFLQSAGISLTDTYWLCDINNEKNISWEDINFHKNGFEPVFANYYENGNITFKPSPDFTTDGIMEKFWVPIYGEPHLFKFDTKYENILSANEIVYFKIAESIGFKTTPYFLGKSDIGQYCFCPCFVKDDKTNFINAMQVKHSDFSKTSERLVHYFMKELSFEKEMREMITLDCLFHNTDRHERNFGYLKHEDNTLSFVPAFDNGFCLGANRDEFHKITDNDMKLFSSSREKILKVYGTQINLDPSFCLNILEDTYQHFNISEIRFSIAKEELLFGMNLLEKNKQPIYYTEKQNDEIEKE